VLLMRVGVIGKALPDLLVLAHTGHSLILFSHQLLLAELVFQGGQLF
jgi:hypothetical protein